MENQPASSHPLRDRLLAAPESERSRHLASALKNWVAAELQLPECEVGVQTDFADMHKDWADPESLFLAMKDWIKEQLGLPAFYPNELTGTRTPALLAEHLVRTILPPPPPGRKIFESLENLESCWYDPQPWTGMDRVAEPTLFILTAPRSGSTLLRRMLGCHPEIHACPELHLLQFDSMGSRLSILRRTNRLWMRHGLGQAFGELMNVSEGQAHHFVEELTARDVSIPRIYRLLHGHATGNWIVDKSPGYTRHLDCLRRAEAMFERPFYIHLTRHPGGMVESMVRMRMHCLSSSCGDFGDENPWTAAEKNWVVMNRNAGEFLKEVAPERQLRIRFEDLVSRPEEILRSVAAHMNVEFDLAMSAPYLSRSSFATGVGDVNQDRRKGLEPGLADAWRERPPPQDWSPPTHQLMTALGYAP